MNYDFKKYIISSTILFLILLQSLMYLVVRQYPGLFSLKGIFHYMQIIDTGNNIYVLMFMQKCYVWPSIFTFSYNEEVEFSARMVYLYVCVVGYSINGKSGI